VRYSPPAGQTDFLQTCRVYTSLANFYSIQTKLFIGQSRMPRFVFGHNPEFLMTDPVDELVGAAEEVVMILNFIYFLALTVTRIKGLQ